jgi:hypothetical protein
VTLGFQQEQIPRQVERSRDPAPIIALEFR